MLVSDLQVPINIRELEHLSWSVLAFADDFWRERRQVWGFGSQPWIPFRSKEMSAVSQPLSHLVSLVIITHCSTDFLFHRTVSQGWTCLRAGLPEAVLESAQTCALRFSQSSLKPGWWVCLRAKPAYPERKCIYHRGSFPTEIMDSSPPHPSSGTQHSKKFSLVLSGAYQYRSFHSRVYFFLDIDFLGLLLIFIKF